MASLRHISAIWLLVPIGIIVFFFIIINIVYYTSSSLIWPYMRLHP